MSKLTVFLELNEGVINSLAKLKIFSVEDFLKADVEKLASSNLSPKEILDLKHKLVSETSTGYINGLELYNSCLRNSAILPTHIEGLDSLLNGGLETGSLCELYGLSGSGKSQICLTIASNVASKLNRRVIYFDTKSDFSAERVSSILSNRKLSEEEIKKAMDRIEVVSCKDMFELVSAVHHLKDRFKTMGKHDCRLIVLDSVTAPYLTFIGTSSNEGTGLLNQLALLLKYLSCEFHVAVLLTNLGIKFADSVGENRNSTLEEDVRPAMGRYWSHVPNTRFLVESSTHLTLTKSQSLPLGLKSTFQISSLGVT